MANILIVEDEKKTAEMLKELIEMQPEYLVVNSCDSIESAVSYLEKNQNMLDLLFLDIQLADGESFEIFEETAVNLPVIFCTAYDEYLLKAFKNNGIDYILKPFKEKDILQALAKFEQLKSSLAKNVHQQNARLGEIMAERKQHQKAFLVRFREKMIPIPVRDISLVMLSEGITYLFASRGEKFPIGKTLEEMENALDDQQFFRINRQMLVNREAIREIEPYFNRKVVVSFDFKLPEKAVVSRLKVTPFWEWLEGS